MAHEAIIRPATPEDVPTLLAFMRATAAEQGAHDAVRATESDILNTLDFHQPDSDASGTDIVGPRHGKAFLIVSPEGEAAGMAFYFTTYVAWVAKRGICLEDLYVLPQYRRRGYARLLIQAIAKEGARIGCARMEWLCYKRNHSALRFYSQLGAKEMDAQTLLRLDGDALDSLAGDIEG